SVKPESVVVVTNVPRHADPFIDTFWLDAGLRLSYPRVAVSGLYFYDDGTPGPGTSPVTSAATVARMLVIRYDASGTGALSRAVPGFVCAARCATEAYDPSARITGPISPRTARRYRIGAE